MNYSRETIARARDQYVAGETVEFIMRDNSITRQALYYWLDGGPKKGDGHLPPLPRRAGLTPRERRRLTGNRVGLVRRIWRAAEGQVRDMEDRLLASEQEPSDRERDARTLAVLARTLRELAVLDERRGGTTTQSETDDDEPMPRDIDEFRRDLARRMDEFAAAHSSGVFGDTEQ
jgi:hypothetical protein